MREIKIEDNEMGQRLDRFANKYLDKAPRNFVARMIRKKNIELNRKKAKPDTILEKGDRVQFFLAEDTIKKFRTEIEVERSNVELDIVYEDKNIIVMNKKEGLLSHGEEGEDNLVGGMVSYLVDRGEYNPEEEATFVPSICNRLDRNTSGLVIGAKNYESLRLINKAIRKRHIERYYKTIVVGELKEGKILEDYLTKDGSKNIVEVEATGDKKIVTHINPLDTSKGYSLLEVEIVTGRTHQIRAHLASINHPIIGDRKYGDRQVNSEFREKYGLKNQWLHGYKIIFDGLTGSLAYLNKKQLVSNPGKDLLDIEKDLFGR